MGLTLRRCGLASIVILAGSTVLAQQDVSWVSGAGGSGDDYGFAVAVDASGSTYVTGSFQDTATFGPYTLTAPGNSIDVFVQKLDTDGNVLWAKSMGGTGYDVGRGIAVDASGNAYVTGHFEGTATFGPHVLVSSGPIDIFVQKLGVNGEVLWAKRMGGVGGGTSSDETGEDITVDGDGNAYVTGHFVGPLATFGTHTLTDLYGIFAQKLDDSGNVEWAAGIAGSWDDWGEEIALDPEGNVYVAGRFGGTRTFGLFTLTSAGSWDVFVTKLTTDGDRILWAKRMGGTGADIGYSLAVGTGGDSWVTGQFQGTASFGTHSLTAARGSVDVFVERLDETGNVRWAKRMGGTGIDVGASLVLDPSGHAHVTGFYGATATFGMYTLPFAGLFDAFVEKLDAEGDVLWVERTGSGDRDQRGFSVALDPSGNVYVTGRASGTSTFGPHDYLSAGSWDVHVEKLTLCGPFAPRGGTYGTLLFSPVCATDASFLPADAYRAFTLPFYRGPRDRFYLSSERDKFSLLAVDDALSIDGFDSGVGPFAHRANVPPFALDVPIEENLVPLPALEVTSLIPTGSSTLSFELLDTDRQVYGNSALYLVQDCGLWLEGSTPTSFHWVSHDDQVAGVTSVFEVRYGFLSELRADLGFARAHCLPWLFEGDTDGLPTPPPGDGYYYIGRGLLSCFVERFGDSNVVPDPRDWLDAQSACP